MIRPRSRVVDVGAIADIPFRGARLVKTDYGCIAIFRTGENEAFALDDKCPHKGGPLSQGIIHDKAVTCPLHNWVINLETGAAQGADSGATNTYTLTVKDGRILLELPAMILTKVVA